MPKKPHLTIQVHGPSNMSTNEFSNISLSNESLTTRPNVPDITPTVKPLFHSLRLPKNAGTAAIIKKMEKEKMRAESPPPVIKGDVIVC